MDDLTRNEERNEKEQNGYAEDALRKNEQSQTSENVEKAPGDENADSSVSSTMDDTTGTLTCPRCGKTFDAKEKHCPYCGLKNDLKICEICGETIAKNAKRCPKCGTKNKKPKTWVWIAVAVVALAIIFISPSNGGKNETKVAAEQSSAEEPGTSVEKSSTQEQEDSTKASTSTATAADEMDIVGKWTATQLADLNDEDIVDLDDIGLSVEINFNTDHTGTMITSKGKTTEFKWNYVVTTDKGDEVYTVGEVEIYVIRDKTNEFEGKLLLVNDDKVMVFEPSNTGSSTQKTSDAAKMQSDSSTVTSGQRNALRSEESYLRSSEFSYTGLIEQLEYEGFSNEDATYAADHCGADWKEQAVKCAESYLKYSSFSKSGLIDQLEFEGFTHEQAEYGADQAY